jgi:hypothetical protein
MENENENASNASSNTNSINWRWFTSFIIILAIVIGKESRMTHKGFMFYIFATVFLLFIDQMYVHIHSAIHFIILCLLLWYLAK